MPTIPLTLDTIHSLLPPGGDPSQLFYFLKLLNERCSQLQDKVDQLQKKSDAPTTMTDDMLRKIQTELSSRGRFPLPLDNLRGQASEPQKAEIIPLTVDPTVGASNVDANAYQVNTMATWTTHIYRVAAGNPHTWVLIV